MVLNRGKIFITKSSNCLQEDKFTPKSRQIPMI